MSSVRRNWRAIHDIVKENHYEHRSHKQNLAELLTVCREIRDDVKNATFISKMDTVKVDKFFPANDNETLERFMKEDNELRQRQRGFYELMKTLGTENKKKFTESLLSTIFSLQYKQQHKWQSVG